MRKLVITCLISGIGITSGYAQTLFTYGTHSVAKNDFLRVYKKNSINKKPDMTDTALRTYLDLYGLFRMKVAEADKQHLDTVDKIQKDLDTYRKQLAKNYLTDEQVTNKLIKEAYDRSKEDVHVKHILINCPPGSDSTLPYRKADSIYNLIVTNKAKFEDLAKQFSDDKGSKENGGDIGFFSAMQTVYSFENVAYSTPVGKMSKPFRSQFGYHIVKVIEKRADRGQIKVAQILFLSPKSRGEEGMEAARKRADSVIAQLKKGTSFAVMARALSEDKYSVNDSGVMKQFGVGRYQPVFENAAFSLKNIGEYSQPVKTDYGYHIIKLLAKYPVQPYDSVYTTLKHKVENDSRAQTAREIFFNKIKEKNGYREYPENVSAIVDKLMSMVADTGKAKGTFKSTDFNNMTKPVFTLAGKNYLQNDYMRFLENLTHGRLNGPKQTVVKDAFGVYVSNVVTDFQEHKLVEENPDFRILMEEYRDGIMLFELMDRNVWSKATKDSAGLKAFYESHKTKYVWENGFEGSVYTFKNKASLDTAQQILKAGNVTDEDLIKALNTQNNPDRVTIQRGRYEFSKFRDATQAELTANKTKVMPGVNGTYRMVVARQVFTTPGIKTLDEARGYVVAEYQDHLEKEWNAMMKKEYPMKVNEKVFQSMVGSK
ncbi:hypothetical protein CJD36_001185 [Flavipsychrobacter stenotrophus]|uniref:PpiC domain-containing protein n=1 Tax=Flavipsychrobacter stenotrophus TaxID=2077091 RepID=A0A2S7SZL3_9BACT|nr:peptidylprolyl isomerase [Flavipsychrobacter stenotrophus]PQJ12393.1 hypothetical protein CJD36_001185 [Flavipsychrobacter stenotrophus]